MDIAAEVIAAERAIRPYVRETYLEYSPFYSRMTGAQVYCKLENLQYTGSFKLRGAMNKLLSLTAEERRQGVVTASTGNHGAAFAYGLGMVKGSGVVFVPENASPTKVAAIERLGAEVRHFGLDSGETEAHARRYAAENRMTHLPPYNDINVIGGQGTIAFELKRQLEPIDAIFVALGGGGMISGIAGFFKAENPAVQIFGCSPENSQVMIQSVKAGRILDLPSLPTLSDGTAGGVEPGSITLEFCRDLVDGFITVSEEEIKDSLREFINNQHMLIEGSAAVAVAACKKRAGDLAGKNVVVVICGGNISAATLKEIL
ncbi:MAG: threonine/serine dehydratase [Deltaproteobacteria bacterium]|jgi:threonine dehydratase|nr:threonine/serine dehydratase [Deltaproteobacteria bacterium]